MAAGGIWHKTLVYFGLADEDEDYSDETIMAQTDAEEAYKDHKDRLNVRKIDRSNRRRQSSDFDDIFTEEHRSSRASIRSLPTAVEKPQVRVHLVVPKNFNDAQMIADKFKADIPVIVNLQQTDTELAKRLIDFTSGLTYALDGGMQRVAEKVFLLTPKGVEVSAEERQRIAEKGFYNQS